MTDNIELANFEAWYINNFHCAPDFHVKASSMMLCAWQARASLATDAKPYIAMKPMQNSEGKIEWYFDCADFYADIAKDENGKFSILFQDRKSGNESWADQVADAQREQDRIDADIAQAKEAKE